MDIEREKYTLVRGTGAVQRLWYLYHRLGIWSNVIVSARYVNESGKALSRETLVNALRVVVQAHPALWQVFVQRLSGKKGCHDLHTAVLLDMDLNGCIEYLDDDVRCGDLPSRTLEDAHNEWQWTTDEPSRPWWKVLVTGQNVIFVFHHSIGDGISGMVFHRELLAALNSAAPTTTTACSARVSAGKAGDLAHIPKEPEDIWDGKSSALESIWMILVCLFMRLFYGRARLFGNLPPSKSFLKSVTAVAEADRRTVTRISSHRISAGDMARILAACRAQRTTFTPLLITVTLIVLATEFYPDAKVGATRFNFDLRPILAMRQIGGGTSNGTFFNAAANWQRWHRLAPLRRAVVCKDGSLDAEAVWDLVRSYKADMSSAMSGKALRMWIGLKDLGPQLENILTMAFPSTGLLLRPTFAVSNIGAFANSGGTWQIDDVQLSAGAVNGNQGSHGIVFHVAGVKDGHTTINATYEDGIVPTDMATRLLDRVVARILDII